MFYLFSFNIYGQSIDPSILSQLSSEEIEVIKEAYSNNKYSDTLSEDTPLEAESLIKKESNKNTNEIDDKKFDNFFINANIFNSIWRFTITNDYKISLKDSLQLFYQVQKMLYII